MPAHGQIPGPPGTLTQADIAVAGPMARTAADLELALDLMSGPDRWNHPAWRLELPPPRATDLGRLPRGDVVRRRRLPARSRGRRRPRTASSSVSRQAGCRVEHEVTPGFDLTKAAVRFHALVTAAVSGGFSPTQIEEFATAAEGDDPVAVTKQHTSMRHRQWLSHNEGRLQLRRRFETFFEDHDILLLPVMPCVAIGHDHSEPIAARVVTTQLGPRPYWELNRWMAPAGVCFLPATVIPVAVAPSGLPVGVQIVGPYLHDRTTLAFAAAAEAILGPCPTPPDYRG